ncbi:MAG: hypothetical protein JWN00_5451 [Actinomycetia bacterium]|nr:hypothetical protein [Actinomycetes bacterium]
MCSDGPAFRGDAGDRHGADGDDHAAGFDELAARYQADPRLTVPATVRNGVLDRVDEV